LNNNSCIPYNVVLIKKDGDILKGFKMNGPGKPFEILDNFLFPKIFQAFRMAIRPTKLLLAFFALSVICLAGWLMDFSKTVVVTPIAQGHISELEVYLSQPERVPLHITGYKTTGDSAGVFSTLWNFAASKFQSGVDALLTFNLPAVATDASDFVKAASWAFRYHFVYSIIFTAVIFIVISIAGGCLCRLTALQFTRSERAGLAEALQFVKTNFTSFFAAPLAPAGIIIFTGLLISVLGLITNIPYVGELIIAVTLPVALMAGMFITIILIGTVGGFNLMFPAVACDGSDCFDAISKAFSYIYSKPWRMGFYTLTAGVYGAICYTFVRFCTFLLLSATYLFLQLSVWADNSAKETNKLLAIWPPPQFKNLQGYSSIASTNSTEFIAVFLVHLSLLIIVGLLVSFVISFYFSANTIIYILLRNRVDNIALEAIYTYSATAKPKPADVAQQPQTDPDKPQV
jgi:hypothetical protein